MTSQIPHERDHSSELEYISWCSSTSACSPPLPQCFASVALFLTQTQHTCQRCKSVCFTSNITFQIWTKQFSLQPGNIKQGEFFACFWTQCWTSKRSGGSPFRIAATCHSNKCSVFGSAVQKKLVQAGLWGLATSSLPAQMFWMPARTMCHFCESRGQLGVTLGNLDKTRVSHLYLTVSLYYHSGSSDMNIDGAC